jgi:hypothetical protein
VVQLKLGLAIWTVSDLMPYRDFLWQSATLGLTRWSNPIVTSNAAGESKPMLFRLVVLL